MEEKQRSGLVDRIKKGLSKDWTRALFGMGTAFGAGFAVPEASNTLKGKSQIYTAQCNPRSVQTHAGKIRHVCTTLDVLYFAIITASACFAHGPMECTLRVYLAVLLDFSRQGWQGCLDCA